MTRGDPRCFPLDGFEALVGPKSYRGGGARPAGGLLKSMSANFRGLPFCGSAAFAELFLKRKLSYGLGHSSPSRRAEMGHFGAFVLAHQHSMPLAGLTRSTRSATLTSANNKVAATSATGQLRPSGLARSASAPPHIAAAARAFSRFGFAPHPGIRPASAAVTRRRRISKRVHRASSPCRQGLPRYPSQGRR